MDYDSKAAKIVRDTFKNEKPIPYVRREIELMTDGNSIMSNIHRYIKDNIMGMDVEDANSCFSILETLKGASCLDLKEVDRIYNDVRIVYKDYCRAVAGSIQSWKGGEITEEEFNEILEDIINDSSDKLRDISQDRAALAYTAYTLSLENGYSSQSFPFVTVTDGMVALLSDVRTVDYYDIKIRCDIPDTAAHLIVYKNRFRLPESICRDKVYFGNVSLPNGSYELHRDLKGGISLIVPKPSPKDRLNVIPYSETAKFSLKISYKASELLPEHQNGEFVTQLMADGVITFKESTINGNTQYCVYADDVWVGSLFDDRTNKWVLRKEVARSLFGKEYRFICIPRTGVRMDSNSFVTSTGKYRTAQVITFERAVGTCRDTDN
jgi:hypothetical protein